MPPHNSNINRPKGTSLRPLRAIGPFIRPYLGTLFLAMGALLVASGAFLALPVAVRYVIDFGFSAADAATVDRYFYAFLGRCPPVRDLRSGPLLFSQLAGRAGGS